MNSLIIIKNFRENKCILNCIKKILTVFSILLLLSCNEKKNESLTNLSPKLLTASNDSFQPLGKKLIPLKHILLEKTKAGLISSIDKIKVKNNIIYILDNTGLHYLYVFGINGNFIRKIGKRGKGPGEYSRLCDFDIDKNGNIYLYDRQHKKLLIYDSLGFFIKEKNLPFRADAFNLLNEGKYIFSVVKENNFSGDHPKIVITDSLFFVKKSYFSYDEKFLDNKGNTNIFNECSKGLLYNKPVNDSIFLFDKEGVIIESYFIDFGPKALPEMYKNDYIKYIQSKNKSFLYIYRTPFLISNYILGNMYLDSKKAIFLYDLEKDNMHVKLFTKENISCNDMVMPMFILNDSTIISYFDYEVYLYSKDKNNLNFLVKKQLEEGGNVLSVFRLLKN